MTCHDPCLAHLVIGLLQMLSGDSGDADLLHFLASRSHRWEWEVWEGAVQKAHWPPQLKTDNEDDSESKPGFSSKNMEKITRVMQGCKMLKVQNYAEPYKLAMVDILPAHLAESSLRAERYETCKVDLLEVDVGDICRKTLPNSDVCCTARKDLAEAGKDRKTYKTCILVQIFLYASFRWQGPHQDWNLQPFGFSARTLVWHATRTWHWPRPRHACKQQQIRTVAKESKLPTSTNCVLGRRWGLPIALDIPCFLEPQTRSIYLSENQTDIGNGSTQTHWSPEICWCRWCSKVCQSLTPASKSVKVRDTAKIGIGSFQVSAALCSAVPLSRCILLDTVL